MTQPLYAAGVMLGHLSRADYLAACAAKREASKDAAKEARIAAQKAKAAARLQAAEQARQQKALERAQAIVARMRVPNKPRVVVGALDKTGPGRTSIAPVKQQIAPPQSVEEWLAKGGQVEVLHPHAVSKPFRAIGFNNREAA